MKLTPLLSILLLAVVASAAGAQEEPTAAAEGTEANLAEAAEEPPVDPLVALTEPGDHHEHLDRLAGDWDLTIKVWTSPDGEPTESAGSAESRWILGGRFLWTIYRAELFGQPFEAWSIEGYDNQKQEYVSTWRDTQGTYTLVYSGKCKLPPLAEGETEADGKAETRTVPDGTFREMNTKLTDPVSGEKLDLRSELRIQEDGRGFVQESFVVLSPEESLKNLELIGKRRDE